MTPVEAMLHAEGVVIFRRLGDELICPCPSTAHSNQKLEPTLYVNANSGLWQCKGGKCGLEPTSGDALDFIQAVRRCDFKTARELYPDFAPAPSHRQKEPSKVRPKKLPPWAGKERQSYHQSLLGFPDALNYLKSRGVTEDQITSHQIGYGEVWMKDEKPLAFTMKIGESAWAKVWPMRDAPRKFAQYGNWTALQPPRPTDQVVVVESYLDALMLQGLGFNVASFGSTSNFVQAAKEWPGCIFVPDCAESAPTFKGCYFAEIKGFKSGYDPGDYYRDHGPTRTKTWFAGVLEQKVSCEPTKVASDAEQWESELLEWDKNGSFPIKTKTNLVHIIQNNPSFASLRTNTMGDLVEIHGREIRDSDILWTTTKLYTSYGVEWSKDAIFDVIHGVAETRPYQPVVNYLKSLKWDGEERLCDIIGSVIRLGRGQPADLATLYIRKWMISAVARAFDPGCKVDTMLVFYSQRQGIGKSTFARVMATRKAWFSDQGFDPDNKDTVIEAHHHWIVECSELDAITRKKDVAAIRSFLSREFDRIRAPYDRCAKERRRQFVFFGSTNNKEVIREMDGRRYWVIEAEEIDLEFLTRERDQLWAEAVAAYHAGERWWLNESQNEQRLEASEQFMERDPINLLLDAYLEAHVSSTRLTIPDVVKWASLNGHQAPRNGQGIGGFLERRGWVSARDATKRWWQRHDSDSDSDITQPAVEE